MIEPFDITAAERAVGLLQAGFPERSADFWAQAFRHVHPHVQGEIPLGWIMKRNGQDAGVLLTFARRAAGSSIPQINLSSWYVDPAHRLAAPAMLRAVLKQNAEFFDLTPTESVAAMMPLFGFTQSVDRLGLVLLPWYLTHASSARVDAFDPDLASGLGPAERAVLSDHAGMGLRCYVLHSEDGPFPLILASIRTRYGPGAAQFILAPPVAVLEKSIGSLARALTKEGFSVLALEYAPGETPSLTLLKSRPQARFHRGAHWAKAAGAIDYTYSELAYLQAEQRLSGMRRGAFGKKLVIGAATAAMVMEVASWAN